MSFANPNGRCEEEVAYDFDFRALEGMTGYTSNTFTEVRPFLGPCATIPEQNVTNYHNPDVGALLDCWLNQVPGSPDQRYNCPSNNDCIKLTDPKLDWDQWLVDHPVVDVKGSGHIALGSVLLAAGMVFLGLTCLLRFRKQGRLLGKEQESR